MAEEADGELTEEARRAFLHAEGHWELRMREPGQNRTEVARVLRERAGVPLTELPALLRGERPILAGIQAEVEQLGDALKEAGATVIATRDESDGGFSMVTTRLRRRFAAIASDPNLLEEPCPAHLGAFFYGYSWIATAIVWLDVALEKRFPPPPVEARAWSRAQLQYGALEGVQRLLAAADELLASRDDADEESGDAEPSWWVTVVADAVRQRRIGMILGECSLAWLNNYGIGSDAALEDHFPDIARERAEQMLEFERWLQRRHEAPRAPWHRILRVVYGPGATGVEAFGAAWDEYAERTSGTIEIG